MCSFSLGGHAALISILPLSGRDSTRLETLHAKLPPFYSRGTGLGLDRLSFRIFLLYQLQAVALGLEHEDRTHDGAEQGRQGEEVISTESGRGKENGRREGDDIIRQLVCMYVSVLSPLMIAT